MKELSLSKYTSQAENLLTEAKTIFKELQLPVDKLPDTMQPADGAIKLVFVGQYSAGKSSIIKMLSGIETGIGAGITTQESHIYHWNDLEIIDTPGIQTGIRPDHDEITYEQISQAALLVFVVTNEGFDRQMGEHFRKLAIEQKRGGNMVLVINKMDRAPEGNSLEQQKIIRDDICKVLQPLTPEDLYLSFVSTQSYDEYLTEEDEEIKAELLAESGREQLIDNLNAFVSAKQITAKIERPVYTLDEAVRQAAGTPDDHTIMDGTEDLLKRKYRIIDNARMDTEQDIQSFTMDCQQNIITFGDKAAGYLEPGISEKEMKEKLADLQQRAEAETDKCVQKVNWAFSKMANTIQSEIDRELSSPYAKKIFQMNNMVVPGDNMPSVNTAAASINNSGQGSIVSLESVLKSGSKALINTAVNSNAASMGTSVMDLCNSGLKNFSGSMLHEGILGAGKFFGVKFKPWQAVGLAKNAAVFGAVLNVIGIAFTLWDKLQSDEKRMEQERELQKAKESIKSQFSKNANIVYADIMENVREQMSAIVDPELTALQQSMDNIHEQQQLQERCMTCLDGLLDKIQQLQEKIETGAAV